MPRNTARSHTVGGAELRESRALKVMKWSETLSIRRLGYLAAVLSAALSVAVIVHAPAPTTADEPPVIENVQVNEPIDGLFPRNSQIQPALAQNPLDPDNLIAASNDDRTPDGQATGYYASRDGGQTWPCQGTIDLSAWGQISYGDTWQTFDSAGNAYLSTIGIPKYEGKPIRFDTADVFVARSTDGGCTYPTISKVASNSRNISDDKPSIAADTNPDSPWADTVYVAWIRFSNIKLGQLADDDSRAEIVVSRSTDGGETWRRPIPLSEKTAAVFSGVPPRQGANVEVGPDGSVYVTWADIIDFSFVQRMAISRDGGKTFGDAFTVAPILDDFSTPGGASFRQLGRVLPSLAIAPEGAIFLGWAERQGGHARAVLTASTDGGTTWSTPAVVGDIEGRSAVFVSVAAGPEGAVDVAFLAMKDVEDGTPPTAGIVSYDAYVVRSVDGGETFGAPIKVSTESSDPEASSSLGGGVQFIGDYITAVAGEEGTYVVWTDTRNGAACEAVTVYRLGGPPPDLTTCPPNFGNTDIYLGIVPNH